MRKILAVLFAVGVGGVLHGATMTTKVWAQDRPPLTVDEIVPGGEIGEFRHGTFPSLGQRTHAGVDITPPRCGSPALAWKDGQVADIISTPDDRNFNSLGYMVLLSHGAALPDRAQTYSIYMHFSEPPATQEGRRLSIGDRVSKGNQIGKVGDTGVAYGCHLHFEIRHFSSRFSPTWNNIYGTGDKRHTPQFLSEWTDPLVRNGTVTTSNPFANYSDDFLGSEEVEVRVTSEANRRNYPSTNGTEVLGELSPGKTIKGRWVRDIENDRRWLKVSTGGYVWDGNLGPLTESLSSIPARFHGIYDVTSYRCSFPNSDMQTEISANKLRFYVSYGQVTSVEANGGIIKVGANMESEGQKWEETFVFTLSGDTLRTKSLSGDPWLSTPVHRCPRPPAYPGEFGKDPNGYSYASKAVIRVRVDPYGRISSRPSSEKRDEIVRLRPGQLSDTRREINGRWVQGNEDYLGYWLSFDTSQLLRTGGGRTAYISGPWLEILEDASLRSNPSQ